MEYAKMYETLPNLVIGFHGCDQSTFDSVIKDGEMLAQSENKYDWLGNGMYFWENSYERAWDWASVSEKVQNPAVIGAVIDLGYCLNLTDYHSANILQRGYQILTLKYEAANEPLPQNHANRNGITLLRDLDCAVIQELHRYHKENNIRDYDSVRGVFPEGIPPYEGAGMVDKTHIQLCVVNPNCIKGFFSPRGYDNNYPIP